MLILQVCEFLDNGDGVYRFHGPSRQLSRLPGVTVIDCDLTHRHVADLLEKADVVVFQGFDWELFPLVERRRARGQVTVLEANDYYPDVQPWNPRASMWLDRATQEELQQCMAAVDAVQTSTAELARRWRPWARDVVVFANQLGEVTPLPEMPDRPLTVGWGGSTGHVADWYQLAPGLKNWLEVHPDVHLAVMGDESFVHFLRLPAERLRFVAAGSLASFQRFLTTIDIGLAPLLATDFNRGRSDVKYLEYASSGVVGVYPDLEPYRGSVVAEETGLLYHTDEELFHHLDRLVSDDGLRRRLRKRSYEVVTTTRRLEGHVQERYAFYEQLLTANQRRGGTPREDAEPWSPGAIAAAVVEGSYYQLRPGEPEQILQDAKQGAARRESVGALERLIGGYPNYLPAHQQIGKLLNDLRDPEAAARYLQNALKLDPQGARTRCELGRAYFLRGDIAVARKHLEAALTLNPGYQLGWQYLLRLLSIHRSADGPVWAERARQSHPRNFQLALLAAKVEAGASVLTRLDQWLDVFAADLGSEERPGAVLVFGQTVSAVIGPFLRGSEALALLRRGADLFPESACLADLLGLALWFLGRHDEARTAYCRALAIRRQSTIFSLEYPKDAGNLLLWQVGEHLQSSAPVK